MRERCGRHDPEVTHATRAMCPFPLCPALASAAPPISRAWLRGRPSPPPLSQALLCALLCSVGLCGANAGATRPARGARSRVWRRCGASRRPARDDPPGKGEAEAALLLPGGGRRGRPPPPRRRSHAACCPAPPVALVIRPLNLSGPLFLFLSFLFFSSTFLTLIVFSSLASGCPVLGICVFPRFFLRGGGWRPTRRPLGARGLTHLSRLTALARRRCGRDRAWRRLGTLWWPAVREAGRKRPKLTAPSRRRQLRAASARRRCAPAPRLCARAPGRQR